MATLEINVRQVNSDFQAIKNELVKSGVEVAEGTKTSEYADKVGEVYEAGRKAEHDVFWDNFLIKTSMLYGFAGSLWSAKTFRPPAGAVIQPTNAIGMFYYSRMQIDLAAHLEELDVTFDFSVVSNMTNVFAESHFTRLGEIKTSSTTLMTGTFSNMTYLVTIDKLIVPSNGKTTFSGTFSGCTKLANLTIEGTIGNNISFAPCPLTAESALSVAAHLSDNTETGNTRKLTISPTTYNNLVNTDFDEDHPSYTGNAYDLFNDHCEAYGWIVEVAQ